MAMHFDPIRPYHFRAVLTLTLCSRILRFVRLLHDDVNILDTLRNKRAGFNSSTPMHDINNNINLSTGIAERAMRTLGKIMIDADTILFREIKDIEKRIGRLEQNVAVGLKHDLDLIAEEQKILGKILKSHKQAQKAGKSRAKIRKSTESAQKKIVELDNLNSMMFALLEEIRNVLISLDDEAKAQAREVTNIYTTFGEWSARSNTGLENLIRRNAIEIGSLLNEIKRIHRTDQSVTLEKDFRRETMDTKIIERTDRILIRRLEDRLKELHAYCDRMRNIEAMQRVRHALETLQKKKEWLRTIAKRERNELLPFTVEKKVRRSRKKAVRKIPKKKRKILTRTKGSRKGRRGASYARA